MSPLYVAVSLIEPVAVNVNAQLPEPVTPKGPVQLSPELAVTATLPVGTPFAPVTEKVTVTASPTVAGLGVLELMVVVLVVVFTVIVTESVAVV